MSTTPPLTMTILNELTRDLFDRVTFNVTELRRLQDLLVDQSVTHAEIHRSIGRLFANDIQTLTLAQRFGEAVTELEDSAH